MSSRDNSQLRGRLKNLRDRLRPPVAVTHGVDDDVDALIGRLGDLGYDGALEMVRFAEQQYREPGERAEIAERRAIALIGSAGIAASLTVAGAGLLLDSSHTFTPVVRFVVGLSFIASLACLLMSSFRAIGTLKVLNWSAPPYLEMLPQGQDELREKILRRAAQLLNCAARNQGIARWKIAMSRAATTWFSAAVVALAVSAIVLLVAAALTNPADPPMLCQFQNMKWECNL